MSRPIIGAIPLVDIEKALFCLLYDLGKPVLGICRGIQIINAILGGTLYQDLTEQSASSVEHHQSPPYESKCMKW